MRIRIRFQVNLLHVMYLSKIEIYLSLGLHKRRSSYRRRLEPKREHPALQNMQFLYFFLFLRVILPPWIRIRIQPTQINADLIGSGSTILILTKTVCFQRIQLLCERGRLREPHVPERWLLRGRGQ
jgi:hypothetical protein